MTIFDRESLVERFLESPENRVKSLELNDQMMLSKVNDVIVVLRFYLFSLIYESFYFKLFFSSQRAGVEGNHVEDKKNVRRNFPLK